jgi:hypothetical protein
MNIHAFHDLRMKPIGLNVSDFRFNVLLFPYQFHADIWLDAYRYVPRAGGWVNRFVFWKSESGKSPSGGTHPHGWRNIGTRPVKYRHEIVTDDFHAEFGQIANGLFIAPEELIRTVEESSDLTLPGWEPEKMARIKELFEAYQTVGEKQLWANLEFFLHEILPVAEEHGIQMAIHPDDPVIQLAGESEIFRSFS